ncbi:small G protein signaling modulator 2 isoform X2 [Nematostella vectensis]|uniref:small G protein signaling modulator 2 isoform X2 n=1 Tax=Nematostella vectensis TaxID=45351 RepID=UPI0020770BBC|nr:small G protein signaling modulator 2 isoform X2 [Nematostella vectensis]
MNIHYLSTSSGKAKMAPPKDVETRQKLLETLKREVKQIMEEAVMKKFIHADSSTITSLCAAVQAGLTHGLKKRAGGLLPAYDTQTILEKLAKMSEAAAELVKELSGNESSQKLNNGTSGGPGESPKSKLSFSLGPSSNSSTKKINGYSVTGHCGKYLWIRIALLEKLLTRIVVDLKSYASMFYEPEALIADPVDGQIFIELLDGPCALDFSKMKTPDSYWTDPSADELVQRHKIHSSLYPVPSSPNPPRPQLGATARKQEENTAVAPVMAREHIESLHQNSYTTLLYGKNNVNVQPHEKASPIPGYLSLHKSNELLVLKWTPNTLMSGSDEKEKSLFWDYALTVNLNDVVYLHCHQQSGSGVVILIGQDGVQRPPIHFPTAGSLLSFLNCLENGLHPFGQLDPPLFAPRSRGLVLPSLKKTGESSAPVSPNKELNNQDYVFRLVSATKPEDVVSKEMEKLGSRKKFMKKPGLASGSKISSFSRRLQKHNGQPTRESLHSACETMRRQITLRAFNGWSSYVRHLQTVRTHLSFLVSHDTVTGRENGEDFTCGLTEEAWNRLFKDGSVTEEDRLKKYVYFGGISHSLRKEVWPYLLKHYTFGSTPESRRQTDLVKREEYQQILEDWRSVETYIIQNEKDHEVDGLSMGSTGSRDEVFEQLEMISTGLEKTVENPDGKDIEEPAVEGLDETAKLRIMNGQDLSPIGLISNGDDAESGCCDCGDLGEHTCPVCRSCGKRVERELNGNCSKIPNGHVRRESAEGMRSNSEPGAGDILCKQCSQDSSSSSCPYSAELLDNLSMNLHRIDKDVQRCDRNYWYFTQENLLKLRNVISSYVWTTLNVGYVQGMCDLVAPLLVIFDDESITYSCFVQLMDRMNNNFPHGGAMDLHFSNMRSLIQVLDPEMFEHLQQNGDLTHFYFCYRWFLLDFKRELLYDDVFKVWETIWAARHCTTDHFVLFIALALLQFYRDIILDNKMDFTDIIKFFNEMAERHDAKAALEMARTLITKVQELIKNQ